MNDELAEAKRLTQQATSYVNPARAVVDLTLAVQILIGLVEGHRHQYTAPDQMIGIHGSLTGPMQAREGQL